MCEQDAGAAPSTSTGEGDDQSQTHNDMGNVAAWQFKIEDYPDAEEANLLACYLPYDYTKRWGFQVNGPVTLTKEVVIPDKLYRVTFMLSQKSPMDFYIPGDPPKKYKGPIEDKTVEMSNAEIEKIRGQWSPQGGAPGASGQGGTGAPPPPGMPGSPMPGPGGL